MYKKRAQVTVAAAVFFICIFFATETVDVAAMFELLLLLMLQT